MPLPIHTRLSNARQQRIHVSDMEPLVAALFWNREERKARETIRECRSMPSEHGYLADMAEQDAEYARNARRAILTLLLLERAARNHVQITQKSRSTHSMTEPA